MARLLLFCSSSRPTTARTRQRKRRVLSSFSSWASSSRRPWCRSAPRTPSRGNCAAAAPVVEAADGGGAVPSGRKRVLASSLSGIGSKAAAIAKMVSWNRRSPGLGSSSDDEEAAAVEDKEAVWRKAIIMGDKCRPLQFSGHIAFDSDGNQLPPAPAKKAAADVAEN